MMAHVMIGKSVVAVLIGSRILVFFVHFFKVHREKQTKQTKVAKVKPVKPSSRSSFLRVIRDIDIVLVFGKNVK